MFIFDGRQTWHSDTAKATEVNQPPLPRLAGLSELPARAILSHTAILEAFYDLEVAEPLTLDFKGVNN